MPKLLVEKGPNKGQSLVLSGAGPFFIGREPGCAFVLNDSNVSRKHCELTVKGGAWSLKDLGSRNGTYVNGKKLAELSAVRVGDRIQTGEILISFLDEQESKDKGGLIGTRVGGYRIIERLGRGGMGTVYKANQIALNREVALKVLSPDLVQEEVFKNLFIAEARTAAAFNHPNVVQIHDVGVEAGLYYFSMELMANGSVHDLVTRDGRLPAAKALRIAMDAAAGLAYAERKGIVHRDIKPENLMIGETGVVKIGDLGLAFHVGQAEIEDEVGVMGTPHFCAPEQVTRGKLDHRTDLYALGATMYRMLAGKPPFVGSTLKEILVKKVKEKAVPLTEAVKGLPAEVSDLVMQLLERNPAERPHSAEEVKGRIEAILPTIEGHGLATGNSTRRAGEGSTTISGPPNGQVSSSGMASSIQSAPTPRPAATVMWLAAATLLLAVAVGLIGWQYLHKKDQGTSPPPVAGGNGNGNGTGDTPPVTTDQDLANEKLQEAERWIEDHRPKVPAKDFDFLCIERYNNVIEKFGKTTAAGVARREVAKLQKEIQELAAADKYAEAQKFEEECADRFADTLSVPDLVKAAERYEEVARDCAGTTAGGNARNNAADVRKRVEQAGETAAAWEKTKETATGFLKEERFKEARSELDIFVKTWRDSAWNALARAEGDRVVAAARDHWDRFASGSLNDLVSAKDWDGATKAIGNLKGRYGIDDLEQRLVDTEKKIAELAKGAKPPDPVKSDQEIEAEALGAASELLAAWKFSEASARCRDAAARVKSPESQARLAEAIDDADLMDMVKRALRSHANGNDKDDSGMQSRAFRGSKVIASADTGLRLDVGPEVPWAKITSVEAFRLSFNGWTVSSREALGLARLLIGTRHWRSARFCCAVANFRDKSLVAAARAMEDRADREERSIVPTDKLARQLFDMEKEERKDAETAYRLIMKSLNTQKDDQGVAEVNANYQLYVQSADQLKQVLDPKPADSEDEWRAEIYLALDALMQGNGDEYRTHSFRARDRKPDESHSRWVKESDEMWKNLYDSLVRCDELRLQIMSKPDAIKVGELLKLHEKKLFMSIDQRVVARWLTTLPEWSRDEYVKGGEPQRILAETCSTMKDYFVAKQEYEKMRRRYPTHPLCVRPENGTRRVDDICVKLSDLIQVHHLGIDRK